MSKDYTIQLDQGSTFTVAVLYRDSNNDPVNLTGYTAKLEAKQCKGDAAVVFALSVGSGITITAATGRLDIVISDTITAALDAKEYELYELQVTSGAGVKTRIMEGKIKVSPTAIV